MAAALGAPGIRVFGDRVQPGADLASTRGWIAESLAALRDRVRGSGVEVWLETHGDFATAAAARSLLEQAGGEGLGLVWDPANAFSEFGEEPEAAAASPRLRSCATFTSRTCGGRSTAGCRGRRSSPAPATSPAARVLAWLVRASYDGWVSFEWEKRWHPEIEEPEVALPRFVGWAADELRARRDAGAAGRAASSRPAACASRSTRSRPSMGAAAAAVVADAIRSLVARDGAGQP